MKMLRRNYEYNMKTTPASLCVLNWTESTGTDGRFLCFTGF